jgi:hypothetical protein
LPTNPALALPTTASLDQLSPRPPIGLSVAQVRRLLAAVLPQPLLEIAAVLQLIAYQQRRKRAAYRSHRKRRLATLYALHW